MDSLDEVLAEMDFDFLGAGEHSMSADAMRKVLGNDHFFFLDVRTEQECQYLNLPFATNIPVHELPARKGELPKDKCIVPLCSSIFRGAVVYTFLLANGFEEVKCLTASTEQIASVLKPGPLAKILS
ncbi:rhodanese-like domain-containing protein [Desulforhopalus vacuolatus]|uniref:rhodanese-like domain-containing protein n=1 Tax=Desulforhopalus vacuolatus TaxID=40414 RepID=UPI0019655B0D|nr:rhodanese-like domain-containing protein [Desulforhopalus vacuolatus]MBM9519195.1 rhodanese-like domain-containing protein [Desulforhopalus vacuolatus]